MTLDSLFAEIAAGGWRVNNLYQSMESGIWRVNLGKPNPDEGGCYFTRWAEAATLADALEDAIGACSEAEFIEDPEQTYSIDTTPRPSLLTQLGLRKPTITRRI